MKIKTYATIIHGEPSRTIEDQTKIRKFIEANEGKEIVEQRKTSEESRSDAQNKFFHAVILPVAQRALILQNDEHCYDKEWIKEKFLKGQFLKRYEGTKDEYIKPSSSLGVKEFWEFVQKCLVLIESIGGTMNPSEQEEYQRIISKYKLETHIADAISRGL